MPWLEDHEAFTSDVREASNLHYPNSCYRPPVHLGARGGGSAVGTGTFVDWPKLKQEAWAFAAMPYDGDAALDFICPAWWNATACECDCGNCSELFEQCPVGFMLFRALALLCDAQRHVRTRLYELVNRKWGCGLLNLARLRLRFIDILLSGWPYFGVLTRISDQLRLDGLSEAEAIRQIRYSQAGIYPARDYQAPSLCAAAGWPEDLEYLSHLQHALGQGGPVPLERSLRAAVGVACPLQRAAAHAATLDWLLRPTSIDSRGGEWLTSPGLVEVERITQRVELEVRVWAGTEQADSCTGRPYFFELLAVAWPIWQMFHRAGMRLVGALALDCQDKAVMPSIGPPTGRSAAAEMSSALGTLGSVKLCPACDCATQGEWAVEAYYVSEYAQRLGEALFWRAACSLVGPAAKRAARIAASPFHSWLQRWMKLTQGPFASLLELPIRSQGALSYRPSPLYTPPNVLSQRREAFATVLFARGAALDQMLLHSEAIRTLAFSVRQHSMRLRPFLVVTDGALPEVVDASLREDGLLVEEVRAHDLSFGGVGSAYGVGSGTSAELQSWWLERGIAPTAIKLAIWNLTQYDCLVFLDADTLVVRSIDELFQIDTFASGTNPYSTHGLTSFRTGKLKYHHFPGINTGVMVLQPSAPLAAEMARQMEAGVHNNAPITEHLGQSDQPWLDAFWLHHSRRLGFARFSGPRPGARADRVTAFLGCDLEFDIEWGHFSQSRRKMHGVPRTLRRRPRLKWWPKLQRSRPRPMRPPSADVAHCMLPLEYDFFADYKAIRMHVWYEGRKRRELQAEGSMPGSGAMQNLSDVEWSVEQYVHTYGAIGRTGVKVLHWPGELRKPWQRWHRAVRSAWDDMWWTAHRSMCRQSAAPCHMHCNR